MTETGVPFLLCLPANKIGEVIERFYEYQRDIHACRFKRPFYLESKAPDIIDISQDTEQQLVDEVNRELSENSDIKEHLG